MKQLIIIIAILIKGGCFAQNHSMRDSDSPQFKDTRATVDVYGSVDEVFVSPDGSIWLCTAVGNTYYTRSFDSLWHYGPIHADKDDFGVYNQHLDRISFFNKDTAIMTGYISTKRDGNKDGYYLTKDGGKTWELRSIQGDNWMYTAFVDKQGNAWLGGLSKNLYYSHDFGQTWRNIKMPYKKSDRTYQISMTSSQHGFASSDDNEILQTRDNWKTVSSIPTPLDQKVYRQKDGEGDKRIEKLITWRNYLITKQFDHFFYTDVEKIAWKPFPVKTSHVAIEANSDKLYTITDSLQVIYFTSPETYRLATNHKLESSPNDMKVVGDNVFIYGNDDEMYRISNGELHKAYLYTTDKKIPQPAIVRHGKTTTWGITDNHIYRSEDKGKGWLREAVLDTRALDFRVENDSAIIIWNGKDNYSYSLKEKNGAVYYPEHPLRDFFSQSIRSFVIEEGSQGCFHSVKNEVQYAQKNDSVFTTYSVISNDLDDEKRAPFTHQVSLQSLTDVLKTIDASPLAIPTLQDFNITEQDKQNYRKLVDTLAKHSYDEYSYIGRKKINKEFYYSVPVRLDTIGRELIGAVLQQNEGFFSTTSNWLTVRIINQKNDTVTIQRQYYVKNQPWKLPWEIKYKDQHFLCYNLELSHFVNACIPDTFMDKQVFDNKYLLVAIADYLYRNKVD